MLRDVEMWLACKVRKGLFHMVIAADMARSNQMRIASYILFQADNEEEIGENSDQESVDRQRFIRFGRVAKFIEYPLHDQKDTRLNLAFIREIPTISDGPLRRTARVAHSFKVINTTIIVECVGMLVSRGEHYFTRAGSSKFDNF